MRNWMKLALLGSVMASVPAQAGGVCGAGDTYCGGGVVVSSTEARFDDTLVSVDQPMGHLRSVDYRRSPHVSITRIHSMDGVAGLDDYPSAFGGHCAPESTQYCRADGHAAPAAPAPVIAQPLPAPVMQAPVVPQPVFVAPAPVVSAPVAVAPQPVLRQWTASYNADPSRFTPRQYGSLDFVPGVANVPTSWVDRDPARAQAALNASGAGGIAPGPQIGLSRIADDTPGPQIPVTQFMGPAPVQPGSIVQPGPASHGPATHVVSRAIVPGAPAGMVMAHERPAPVGPVAVGPAPVGPMALAQPALAPVAHTTVAPTPVFTGPVAGVAPSGTVVPNLPVGGFPATPPAPVLTSSGHYASGVAADGSYWEKVSGPTLFGETIATQVICKRKLPQEMVNPVVGVPTAVPVPVYDDCAPQVHAPAPHASRYTDGLAGGRWVQ